jgi:hypothetical protein
MRIPNKKDLINIITAGIITFSGGCSFFKTNYIKNRAEEIRKTQQDIFAEYLAKDQVAKEPYPPREEKPFWMLNGDGTYTLNYKVAYGDISSIEKILKDQIPGATISTEPALNKFIITTKDDSKRKLLEELLYNLDRAPPHISLRLEINGELGDLTQDYASKLDMLIKNQGHDVTTNVSAESDLPGAQPRVIARTEMINRWGLQLETKDFALEAMLDVLESHGFVVRLYQTDMLIANNKMQKLGEEEKLLIPAFLQQGINTIQTYNLADVVSSVEITPVIHDGIVETTLKAIIGGSKRPEVRQRIMVPVKDTAEINGVYLKVGQPYSVAGILKNFEIGIIRKDPFLIWPSGQDYQHQVTRIWYTITPRKVILYDAETLVRPEYPVIELSPKDAPLSMLFNQYNEENRFTMLNSPLQKNVLAFPQYFWNRESKQVKIQKSYNLVQEFLISKG